MNVTVTGASGFIGRRLLKALGQRGHLLRVLSRHVGTNMPPGVRLSGWDPVKRLPPEEALREADAVIHLAGEPVAQRWNDGAKQRIRDSRVLGTRHLVEGMAKLTTRPAVLISASAVGYYGSRGDEVLDESSAPGSGFLPEVCVEWEREAFAAKALGVRVAAIRTGLALDPAGGALGKMLPAFKLGAGGRLGDGKQWVPWIHMEDLIELYLFLLDNPLAGPFNGTAPNPVTNGEFTHELARALRRPAIAPVPKFGLKLLFGEMADALFDSQRVVPQAAQAAGFSFRFPSLAQALQQLL